MSFEMENAKASADFIDLTIRIADKYGEDHQRALKSNIVGLIYAQYFFNFDEYNPNNIETPTKNSIDESTLRTMSLEIIEYAEKLAKSYCQNHFARCKPDEYQDVTRQVLQFLAKMVDETTEERKKDDQSN